MKWGGRRRRRRTPSRFFKWVAKKASKASKAIKRGVSKAGNYLAKKARGAGNYLRRKAWKKICTGKPSIGMGRNKVPRRDQVELYPFAPACSLEMEQRGVCKLSDLTHWKLGQTREETGSVQMGDCSKCADSVWRPKLKATWGAPQDMAVFLGPAERRCGCAACPKDRILLKILGFGQAWPNGRSFGPLACKDCGSRRRMA